MKSAIKIGTLLLFLSVLAYSCKDDDDDAKPTETKKTTLTMNFEGTVGSEALEFQKVYNDFKGRKFHVELLKFYISNIELIDDQSNNVKITDVALIDLNVKSGIKVEVAPGNYTGIKMGIGLDPVQNASDPATFKDTHPLSTAQNTYWSWAAKYKFVQIEGKADLDNNGSPESIYAYHTGLDTMYRVKTFTHGFEVKKEANTNLSFTIDVNDIFTKVDTVDYMTEPTWHGSTANAYIGIRLSDNFSEGLELHHN